MGKINMDLLDELKDTKLTGLGRCVDMAVFEFKKQNIIYHLHIQTMWRLCGKNVLLARSDIFCPSELITDYDNFDWDVKGNNIFDSKSRVVLEKESFIVENYKINSFGDLRLCFMNGKNLEVFICNSCADEQWRLFQKGNKQRMHMVVYPSEVSYE